MHINVWVYLRLIAKTPSERCKPYEGLFYGIWFSPAWVRTPLEARPPARQLRTFCILHSFAVQTRRLSGYVFLSSPRAERAGRKGLRAESARAFTGRRCPHSGKGEDFLAGQPDFFTETAVIPERKVEKSFPRWEINRHAEG